MLIVSGLKLKATFQSSTALVSTHAQIQEKSKGPVVIFELSNNSSYSCRSPTGSAFQHFHRLILGVKKNISFAIKQSNRGTGRNAIEFQVRPLHGLSGWSHDCNFLLLCDIARLTQLRFRLGLCGAPALS